MSSENVQQEVKLESVRVPSRSGLFQGATPPTYDAGQVDQLLLTSRVESVPGILISHESKVFLIFGIIVLSAVSLSGPHLSY